MADLLGTTVGRNYGKSQTVATYGLQPRIFTIATSTSGGFSADSESNGITTLGLYSKAIKAVSSLTSIIVLGETTASTKLAFAVVVDDTFNGRRADGASATSADTAAADLVTAVEDATGLSDVVVTEVKFKGATLAAGTFTPGNQ